MLLLALRYAEGSGRIEVLITCSIRVNRWAAVFGNGRRTCSPKWQLHYLKAPRTERAPARHGNWGSRVDHRLPRRTPAGSRPETLQTLLAPSCLIPGHQFSLLQRGL